MSSIDSKVKPIDDLIVPADLESALCGSKRVADALSALESGE